MIASTTKYTLKEFPAFFMFAIMSLKSIYQANNSPGLVAIKIRVRDFRTLTVWESAENLKAFRNSGVHFKAMTHSPKLGFNQSYSWQTESIPTWKEAIVELERKLATGN
ncbi:MAG: hypothetical protein ACFCU7_16505 [Pleurocapsa sp.]